MTKSYYATVAQVKASMQSDTTVEDALLLRYIRTASQRFDNLMAARRSRPYFEPYNEERQYVATSRLVNSAYNTLDLRENLLAFTAVTVDGSAYTSSIVQYPPLVTPYHQLRITTRDKSWYDINSSTYAPIFVSVTGTWGYHDDYANAWLATSLLDGNITDTATTLDVTATEGALFSAGHLIRIGSEYMRVTGVSTDTLTVARGVNGSTASAHTSGDSVEVFDLSFDIVNIIARQAGALYARRGKYEVVDVAGAGIAQYPQDLLLELRAVATEYQYK